MKWMIRFSILLTLTLGSAFPAELTLDDLIDIALANNPDVQMAEMQLKGAKAQRLGSYSGFLPSASLSVNKQLSDLTTTYTDPDTQQEFEFTRNAYSSSASVYQPVFDGGAAWFASRSTENAIHQAALSLKSASENVALEVKSSYYQYLSAVELLEVAELSLALAQSQLELVQQQYDLQAVSQTDLLKARVRQGQAESMLLQYRQNLRSARNALNVSLGRSTGTDLEIKAEPVNIPVPPAIETALAQMLAGNTLIQLSEAQVKGNKTSYFSQFSAFLPTVSISASYFNPDPYFIGHEDFGEAVTDLTEHKPTTSLNFSFPLFSGFANKSRLDGLKYDVLASESSHSGLINDLQSELDNTVSQLETLVNQIPINEQIIESAELDVRLAEEKYNLGANTILDVLNAQVSLIQAKSDLVRIKYDAKIAEAGLEVLLGN